MPDYRKEYASMSDESTDFISEFIREDLKTGRFDHVHTRFPPEPNGWLHIGHCKAFYIDFSMAERFGGKCNLRFDDTNPEKEDSSYVEAIKRDIKWMGYDWEDREYYASDYYEYLYDLAVRIIKKGHAYVDDLSEEEISEYRGTAVADKKNRRAAKNLNPPGQNSPGRDRPVEVNHVRFSRVRGGGIKKTAGPLSPKPPRAKTAPGGTGRWKKTWTFLPGCGRGNFLTGPGPCGLKST
jgi:glutaminyl-tRNA synthetase